MQKKIIKPKHIQIETINGVCSARCSMCTISSWKRPKNIMSMENFREILKKLQGIPEQQFLTLHGLGEPLLDSDLPEKVALAKEMAFNGVGFASNCTHLTEDVARRMLDARLDTLICSVDGFTKQTHEKIRKGTDFDVIVNQICDFIAMRNTGKYKTRVLLRFINQEANCQEWENYTAFWTKILDSSKKDGVLRFDVHNWGEEKKINVKKSSVIKNHYCSDLFERLIIQSTGNLSLCCADDNGYFNLGNALENDPINLYNGEIFTKFRESSQKNSLDLIFPCSECTILQSRQTRILVNE